MIEPVTKQPDKKARSAVKMADLATFTGKPVETLRYWRIHIADQFPTFKAKTFPKVSNSPWWVPLETANLVARTEVENFSGFPDGMVVEVVPE